MKNFFYLLMVIFLTMSCQKKTDLEIREKIIFNVGFNITEKFCGTYYDDKSKQTLIYFSDPVTDKVLKVFKDNGKQLNSIDLSEAVKTVGNVAGLNVKSTDTIILLSKFTNRIAYVNSRGKVYKSIDLNPFINNENDIFELYPSCISNFLVQDALLFYCEWRGNINDSNIDVQKFFRENYGGPYFLKVSNIFENRPTVLFGLKSFYSNIDSLHVFVEPPSYVYVNNHLIVTSIYSDKLFIVNNKDLTIKKTISLSSDFVKLGSEPFPFEENTFLHLQDLVNTNIVPYIAKIFYSSENKRYFLIIYTGEGIGKKPKTKLPFLIMTLNEEFEKINEMSINGGDMIGAFSLMTDKGIMFYSNTNSNDRNKTNKEFIVYNL